MENLLYPLMIAFLPDIDDVTIGVICPKLIIELASPSVITGKENPKIMFGLSLLAASIYTGGWFGTLLTTVVTIVWISIQIRLTAVIRFAIAVCKPEFTGLNLAFRLFTNRISVV